MVLKKISFLGYLLTLNSFAAVPKILSVSPSTLTCGVDNCAGKTVIITGSAFNNDAIVPTLVDTNLAECEAPVAVNASTKKITCTLNSQSVASSLKVIVKNVLANTSSVVTRANLNIKFFLLLIMFLIQTQI